MSNLDKNTRAYMAKLNDDPFFQQHIKTNVLPEMPVIPPYKSDDDSDNTEDWKAASLRKEGFIEALNIMGVNIVENDKNE